MKDKQRILSLITSYLNNPEDLNLKAQVEEFRAHSIENETFYDQVEKVWDLSGQSAVLNNLDERRAVAEFQKRLSTTNRTNVAKFTRFSFLRWVAAAAVVVFLGFAVYLYRNEGSMSGASNRPYASDALPGSNKAVLVLADGRKVSLTDVGNGDVAKEAGLSITKTADGQLVYTISDIGRNQDNNAVNTIETPNGGMWQIKLPDGSNVWLNAASSLTYPLAFSEGQKRIVSLKGEAYFEVAEDKLHPFIVKTATQEVEVLGTHFNINSYTDEVTVKTTLLEGSVKVSNYLNHANEVLKPGEQSILTSKGLEIKQEDADESIDWKNGYFKFNNEKQESIMRKIARWYNVQVEYADQSAKEVTYYGSISRFDNVSKILRKFEQTGEVRFEVEKNKIIVYKD